MASEEGSSDKVIPVRVVVRVRPLSAKEIREGCQECIDITHDSPQIVVRGTDKAFTFDHAYPTDTTQGFVYETSIKNVVQNLFKGYNVTVLAYGQTGSGKTHTMGTTYSAKADNLDGAGIIPRAVQDIFDGVASQTDNEYIIKVSFIELYKETLFDLLSNKTTKDECIVDIREDARGGIKIAGVTEIPVTSIKETMMCLEQGAVYRATGATAMNAHSSRSHAIFSLHVQQKNNKKGGSIVCSKFHMVDLAGSERAKKTGATGERFKEGVNINKGLLALGNVISALCEDGGRGHIPYRDSKLTRLLQDSLGGNSHTVMVACVSPADSNLEESLSTLRYADRARKIKNKPIVNRDPQAAELHKLREQVLQLQIQLLASNGSSGGTSCDRTEVNALLSRNQAMQEEINQLTQALQTALDENTNMAEKAIMAELSRERMKVKMEELIAQTGVTYEALNKTFDVTSNPQYEDQLNLVKDLQAKIVELQSEQHRGAKAIMDHELSRHNISTNTSMIPNSDSGLKDTPGQGDEVQQEGSSTEDAKQFGTEFTLRQARLNEELQGLNRALAMKEELVNKMTVNDTQFVAMREQYAKEKKNLECHIEILSKEKDELMQQLKFAGSASSKVAEQRRKKVQELEAQIGVLRQKQKEQVKLLRLKEQSEQKVNKLNSEIQAMKATRVKLIRQMKEDSEKFRVWKTQKDREVARLKEADRQKQYQIVKMERLHSKKQNVLRRKMEEAIAINKRLKDAMALQKAGSEKRAASKDIAGTGNRIRSWLEGELEVVSVKKQAKQSLEVLIDNRKSISEEISKTKKEINRDPNSSGVKQLEMKLADLESCLQLRTAQISDLQAKFVDDDEDDSNKKRFESMQSMLEAKCAMNYLFEVATKHQVSLATQEADMKDLQAQYDELTQSLDATEMQLKNLKEAHQEERTRLEREHEEKVLFLLGQMSKAEGARTTEDKESVLGEKLKLQEEEIARLTHLHELLQNKTKEVEDLKQKLTEKATASLVTPILGDAQNIRRRTFVKAPKPAATQNVAKKLLIDLSDLESEPEEEDEEEDQKQDPDWRMTPLFKKIRKITQGMDDEHKSDTTTQKPLGKRDSNGEIKCKCKGDCTKKRCSCSKNGNPCSLKCNCDDDKCKNRSNTQEPDSSESNGETCLNSTFDVTSMPLKENVAKKPRMESKASLLNNSDEFTDENSLTNSQGTAVQRTNFISPDIF